MSRSETLRFADIRRVFRLVGDCRDLGHDRASWMARAVDGLRHELRALVVIGSFDGDRSAMERGVPPTFWDVGWPTGRDREAWLALIRTPNVLSYPTIRAIYRRPGKLTVRSREQLVPDREWRLCTELNEDRRPLGQDDTMIGLCQLATDPSRRQLFSINRAVRDRRFGGRDRAFLRLFLEEVDGLAGTALAVDETGPFAGLAPRQRQVLDALLEGDGEKQIAARLGLSRHTVHDHVKALYRRFDVGSRGELHTACQRRRHPR